ncbi:lysophospholipid acyltransferase family protein [Chloroflexota bacterium]
MTTHNPIHYDALLPVAKVVFGVYAPVTTIGIKNIPTTGGVLITSNHASYVDSVLVWLTCPRRVAFLGKKELYDTPLSAWFFRGYGVIPVDRENPTLSMVRDTLSALREGVPVMLAPEGTRSSTGELMPFKSGFVKFAHKARVPILPTAIIGTYEMWPRQSKFPHPGKITVVYGEPIMTEEYTNGPALDGTTLESISDLVRSRIQALIQTYSH